MSGLRCNELAPLFTIADNGIASNMVYPSGDRIYFSGTFTGDYEYGVYNQGYYYRYLNTWTTDWQWRRDFWASVADLNDLLN